MNCHILLEIQALNHLYPALGQSENLNSQLDHLESVYTCIDLDAVVFKVKEVISLNDLRIH